MSRSTIVFNDCKTGQETLRRMASVTRYNSWIYSRIEPYLGRRILEVGCGLGNMTGYFANRDLVVGMDRLSESVELVRNRYCGAPNVEVLEGDICDARLVRSLGSYSLDTAVCINVLEHIENDVLALEMMVKAVGHGGRIVLLVPAGAYLYGTLDVGLGHYRRYQLSTLVRMMEFVGCRREDAFYMNVAGVPGWFLNSRILKCSLLPRRMLGVFNVLTPLFYSLERAVRPPFGLSAVVVGRV